MKTDHTPANWPKNKNQIPLFDDSQAFCLVPTDGVDGHALLQQRIEKDQTAEENARRQLDLFNARMIQDEKFTQS